MSGKKHTVQGVRGTDLLIVLKRRIGSAMGVPWYFVVICVGATAFLAQHDGKTLQELGIRNKVFVVLQSPWQESDLWMRLLPRTDHEYSRTVFCTQGDPDGAPCFQVSVFPEGAEEGTVHVDMGGNRVADFKAESLFVGVDRMSSPCPEGNSVLLKLCEAPPGLHRYAFVGERLYTFETNEPILEYFSQMGAYNMSYPVALGPSFAFFMLDCQCMARRDMEEPSDHADWEGRYSFFYETGSSLKVPMCNVVLLAP